MNRSIRNQGFTLVEMIVALALVAMVGTGLFSVYWMGNNAFARDSAKSDLQYMARIAMQHITADIVQAIHWQKSSEDILDLTLSSGTAVRYSLDRSSSWFYRDDSDTGPPQPIVEKIADVKYTPVTGVNTRRRLIITVTASDGKSSYSLSSQVVPRMPQIGDPDYDDGNPLDDAPVIANAEGSNLYHLSEDVNGETSWHSQPPALFWGTPVDINDIVVNGPTLVMVGEGNFLGRIAVSTDGGNTWTDSLNAQTFFYSLFIDEFNSITYGNGKYVAVARSKLNFGRIVYSADGLNWTKAKIPKFLDPLGELPADNPLNSVFYGCDRFIAVGNQGDIYTSINGEIWTQETSVNNNDLTGVIYNSTGGNFVAVGDNGTIITSTTGQNNSWTAQPSNTNQKLNAITWGTDKYVAVGNHGTIISSHNGQNWSTVELHDTTITMPDGQLVPFTPAAAKLTDISCIYGRYVIAVDPGSTNNLKVVLQSDDNGHTWIVKPVS